MKKIFFATLVALAITFTSCTADALEETSANDNTSNYHSELLLNQKPADTTGGQGGNIPPPPPPIVP